MKRLLRILAVVFAILVGAVGAAIGYGYWVVHETLAQRDLCAAKQPAEAVDCFSGLLQQDPYSLLWLSGRGKAHHDNGGFAAAVADYSSVLSIDHNDVDAYLQRGRSYLSMGQPARARADWEAVLRMPDNYESHAEARKLLSGAR